MSKSAPLARRLTLGALLLAAAAPVHAQDRPQRVRDWPVEPPEPGVLPTVYPPPADVRVEDTLVHRDTYGGAEQSLLALSGSGSGYAAVWMDGRNGNRGLYLGLLEPGGVRSCEELPVNPPVTTRQFTPTVALADGQRGAVVWLFTRIGINGEHVRFFDGCEGFTGEPTPVVDRQAQAGGARGAGGGGGREGGGRSSTGGQRDPALVLLPSGGGLIGWEQDGRITVRRVLGSPRGLRLTNQERVLEGQDLPALGGAHLAASPAGGFACAWDTARGARLWSGGLEGPGELTLAGEGAVLDLEPGARGGWWLLLELETGLAIRHLTPAGTPDRSDLAIPGGPIVGADLAVWKHGLGLLVERAEGETRGRTRSGPIELHLMAADGTPAPDSPLDVIGSGARMANAPRVASGGPAAEQLCVAWTDRRDGDYDVRFVRIGPGGPLGPDQRWNTDQQSSNQVNAEVASNGERVAVVWQDGRDNNVDHVFARLVGRDGAFLTDEFQVGPAPAGREAGRPANPAHPEQRQPSVAMTRGGELLVTWKEKVAGGWTLRAQPLDREGWPAAPAVEVDPGQRCSSNWPAAVAALPAGGGYAVVWGREGGTALVAHLSRAGELLGPASVLGDPRGASVGRPALALLDDGRLFAAWDQLPQRGKPFLRGRFLTAELQPVGPEIAFSSSPWGNGDIDPALVLGPDGGVLMAWTGDDGPTRDVFTRVYDRRGAPLGDPLYISVKHNEQDYADIARLRDGSYVVVWEDDISYRDHIQARRIDPRDWSLGPPVTVNRRDTAYVEAHYLGTLAPLGDGFLAAFGSIRRSQGHDIEVKVVGPGFDRVPSPGR